MHLWCSYDNFQAKSYHTDVEGKRLTIVRRMQNVSQDLVKIKEKRNSNKKTIKDQRLGQFN